MKVGYVRTSTTEQKLDRQLIQMKELGVEKIFQEQQSGKDTNRLEFQKMLKYIRNYSQINRHNYEKKIQQNLIYTER